MYVNDTLQATGVLLAPFADDTCLYATERKEGYVLRKLQRGLNSVEEWSKRKTLRSMNDVKYLGVIFDKNITWRSHTEMIEGKAFRAFITTYSLFKSKRLSTNIKLTLHKALIRSVITYACPAWEFAADTHLLKLQRLQSKVLRAIGNFPRHTPVCELHKAFNIPYSYDYITKLCRKQANILQNYGNVNVCNIGQGAAT
jgi:hypothetical protein